MMRWFSLALPLAVLAPMPAGAAPDLHPFVQGSWNELRTRHAGHPFVVHVWGVTCGPCRTEMPEWGKLLHDRSDLNLVLIDADLVPDDPEAVTAMLTEFGLARAARAENWIFSDDFVERLRYEIDPTWQGELRRQGRDLRAAAADHEQRGEPAVRRSRARPERRPVRGLARQAQSSSGEAEWRSTGGRAGPRVERPAEGALLH